MDESKVPITRYREGAVSRLKERLTRSLSDVGHEVTAVIRGYLEFKQED
jgi:hypothetical protein